MSVRYRDANPEHALMLADFWRARFVETFGHLYQPADLAHFIAAQYAPATQMGELVDYRFAHRLAFDNAGLVGAAKIGAVTLPIEIPEARAMELHRLYLVDRVKGRGVADAMMDWALEQARTDGAEAMYLGVYFENPRAIAFYQRHGFEKVGEYYFHVGAARDREYVMRRARR